MMLLALLVALGLILVNVFNGQALGVLRDKIDIIVYFQSSVLEDDILKIQRSLESLKEVKRIEYTSRGEALTIFQSRHKDDPDIQKALEILGENPLAASLRIKADDPRHYPTIAVYLNSPDLKSLIDKVSYSQNQVVVNRLASIVDIASKIGIAVTALLAGVAVFVTLNTIILTIYSMREEIGVMRLVGASNVFIRGPYMVQGALYGILAAVLSLLIAMPMVSLASPYVQKLLPELSLLSYFYGNVFKLLGYQLLLGIVLGVVSSILAVSRYLRS